MLTHTGHASLRNQVPIATALAPWIASLDTLLEIGSGTGQHAYYLTQRYPSLCWQPSEQATQLAALHANLAGQLNTSLLAPILLDIQHTWPDQRFSAIFTANTLHIIGQAMLAPLFQGIDHCLQPGGYLFIYGPLRYQGRYTSPSNADFDDWLKARDPASGLVDMDQLRPLAQQHGLTLCSDQSLPANNQFMVWQKASG